MNTRAVAKWWFSWVLGPLLVGCGGESTMDEGETDGRAGGALLIGTVDIESACNQVDVIEVVMVATRVGCESPPPAPCTLPAEPQGIEGDRVSCPSSEGTVDLGVELDTPGRYIVQEVWRSTTGESEPSICFAQGGGTEVLVTTQDVEQAATTMLDRSTLSCG